MFLGKNVVLPTCYELLEMLFFPVGIIGGMLLSWKFELAGSIITISSFVIFYALEFFQDGKIPTGPLLLFIAAPGFLFLISRMMSRKDRL